MSRKDVKEISCQEPFIKLATLLAEAILVGRAARNPLIWITLWFCVKQSASANCDAINNPSAEEELWSRQSIQNIHQMQLEVATSNGGRRYLITLVTDKTEKNLEIYAKIFEKTQEIIAIQCHL